MEKLKKKILEKKELKGLDFSFLDEFLEEYKSKNAKAFRILEEKKFNEKSKEFDEIKKAIRKRMREIHGVFTKKSMSDNKKKYYIDCLRKADKEKKKEIIQKILQNHQSTFERNSSYKALYEKILENYAQNRQNTKPKKIADLGCGYNPFAYKYIGCTPKYFATDINNEDLDFIQKYFDVEKIEGKTENLDLTDKKSLAFIENETKDSDICFLFKLLDSLESKKRGSSAELLRHIHSKLIVVSFPTKTISGKSEIKGKRKWFDRIVEAEKYKKEEFVLENEKYVLLKRLYS